jgi:hypothetical protein
MSKTSGLECLPVAQLVGGWHDPRRVLQQRTPLVTSWTPLFVPSYNIDRTGNTTSESIKLSKVACAYTIEISYLVCNERERNRRAMLGPLSVQYYESLARQAGQWIPDALDAGVVLNDQTRCMYILYLMLFEKVCWLAPT